MSKRLLILYVFGFFFFFFSLFVNLKVTLETEVTNKGALALYGRLGFIKAKRLFRYYLNGVDAFRLKLLFPRPESYASPSMMTTDFETHGFISEKQNEENSLEQHCL